MTDLVVSVSLPFDPTILAGQIHASSQAMYQRDFLAYLEYAGTPEQALNPATLALWRTTLAQETQMSPNTINRMLSAVKRVMDAAAEQGYLTYEQAEAFQRVRGVKVGALKERLRVRNRVRIEPGIMRAIIDSIDRSTLIGLRNVALFTTLASSGLRVKELAHLKHQQILKRGDKYLLHLYAQQGKNQEEDREAHISTEAVEAIAHWITARPVESDYIFTSFGGKGNRLLTKPMTPQAAWEVVKKIAAPLVPGVKPHDFRRFVGTQLAKKDLRLAQLALGHKRIETTVKYDLRDIEAGATDELF